MQRKGSSYGASLKDRRCFFTVGVAGLLFSARNHCIPLSCKGIVI